MAFIRTVDISNRTGRVGYGFQPDVPIMFSEIFDGAPQYYPGSTIQIQELCTVKTQVVFPEIIDKDLQWYITKQYLGTWQILGQIGDPNIEVESQGFIDHTSIVIKRYSNYTVTANPATIVAQHEQISLDTCNFYLKPEVYLFPQTNTPVAGFRTQELNPAWLGSSTISKAPLADTEFFQKIGGIGLFLKSGVEGVSIEFKIAVINDIFTDYPAAQVPSCVFIDPNCQQQFSGFIADSPNIRFESAGACEAYILATQSSNTSCVPRTWICPNNPTDIRTWFEAFAQE